MDTKYWQQVLTKMIDEWLGKREKKGGKRTWNSGALAYQIIEAINKKGEMNGRPKEPNKTSGSKDEQHRDELALIVPR